VEVSQRFGELARGNAIQELSTVHVPDVTTTVRLRWKAARPASLAHGESKVVRLPSSPLDPRRCPPHVDMSQAGAMCLPF